MSFVMLEDPIGITAECRTAPSLNTATLVVVEPMSINETPNFISSFVQVGIAEARGLNTKPLILIPNSSADSIKFFIPVVDAVTRWT